MPLVVRGPSGGGVRGGPFHSQNPEAFFLHVPGLKIVQPATAYDAKGLLKAAIRDPDPVLYLEHKLLYRRVKEELPDGDYEVPIGKAEVRRRGQDLTLVTYGAMLQKTLEAAERLAQPHMCLGIFRIKLQSLLNCLTRLFQSFCSFDAAFLCGDGVSHRQTAPGGCIARIDIDGLLVQFQSLLLVAGRPAIPSISCL